MSSVEFVEEFDVRANEFAFDETLHFDLGFALM